MVTIAAVATGFVPAPLLATAPVAWPLVVMAPGSRTLLASRLPHQTCARVARVVLMVAPPLLLSSQRKPACCDPVLLLMAREWSWVVRVGLSTGMWSVVTLYPERSILRPLASRHRGHDQR